MDLTDGRRIYAIGDLHGCIDHLHRAHRDILADLAARPHAHPLILFVGDYTDRGPDSRGVIEHLLGMQKSGPQTICLFGNHDHCFLEYLADPLASSSRLHWLNDRMGGDMTLASYGITGASARTPEKTHDAFLRAVPESHLNFLTGLKTSFQQGNYLFVHAGIRPGIALAQQDLMDLIWIREGFLDSDADHGAIVVHGHTVVPQVEHAGNRIDIDTGAVFYGQLSCLVLEGNRLDVLQGTKLKPLAAPPRYRKA